MAQKREFNVQAGELRNRIRIERPVDGGQDEIGGPITIWTFVATRWGSITPVSGTETVQADKNEGLVFYRIELRVTPALVDETYRLIHDGIIFNITSIRDIDERGKVLIIDATESENV